MKNVSEICEMYEKHGWKIGRVLFSDSELETHFSTTNVEKRESDLDAIWFTRAYDGGVTWEIRDLSGSPYALCVKIPEGHPEEQLEEELRTLEESVRNRSRT